jgi:HK97 family phage portal protein
MALFTRAGGLADLTGTEAVLRGGRGSRVVGAVDVNADTAMRNSAVWACVRLRADHVSTLPIDVFRDVNGIAVEVAKPPVFVSPGGDEWPWHDWVWASQSDLDRTGNAVGLIEERNALNLPSVIRLVNTRAVSVRYKANSRDYKWLIEGQEYNPSQVWHERQHPVSGMVLGLSPVAYAAWTIGEAMSMQDFALKWFGSGGVPRARLKNTQQTMEPEEAQAVKDLWNSTVQGGDLFVTGSDWDYDLMQSETAGMEWLEGRKASVPEIARFFNCPSDMIDGAAQTGAGTVNYANITQKNLQFLIHHLGPTVIRREKTWSTKLLPQPRYAKANGDALLRMDPETREKIIRSQLESHQITPTQARAFNNWAPFTPAEEAESLKFFPAKGSAPKPTADPNADPSQPEGGDNSEG